jgi:hypothetical protein
LLMRIPMPPKAVIVSVTALLIAFTSLLRSTSDRVLFFQITHFRASPLIQISFIPILFYHPILLLSVNQITIGQHNRGYSKLTVKYPLIKNASMTSRVHYVRNALTSGSKNVMNIEVIVNSFLS